MYVDACIGIRVSQEDALVFVPVLTVGLMQVVDYLGQVMLPHCLLMYTIIHAR